GDARAIDGTVSVIQPLVAPFYSVRTVHQILDMLLGAVDPPADTAVRATWTEKFGSDFAHAWRQALHDGFVTGTASPAVEVTAKAIPLPDAPARAGEQV